MYSSILLLIVGFAGYGVGWWTSQGPIRDITALFALPDGEFYATEIPHAIWQKVGPRTLVYRPLPTKNQAQIISLFANPTPSYATTTTTSLPMSTIPKEDPRP